MPSSALQGYTEHRDFIRHFPKYLDKPITFTNKELHKACHLKAILIVTRCSAGVADGTLIPQYEKNNRVLALKYAKEHRDAHHCKCTPTVEQFFLNDYPLNTNLISKMSQPVANIRSALQALLQEQTKGIVAFIIFQDDGFTTNVPCFAGFFRHFVPQLNLLLTILKAPAAVEHPVYEYVKGISECLAQKFDVENPYHHQIFLWASVGFHKQILSAAAVANARANLNKRNSGSDGSYYLTQEEVGALLTSSDAVIDHQAKSFDDAISRRKAKTVFIPQSVPNQINCGIALQKKLAKIEPIDGKKKCTTLTALPRKGRVQLTQYELPRSTDDTCFVCTEAPGCEMAFQTVEGLFEHLTEVMVSLPAKERYCWLCGAKQCERINRGSWHEHFERHFANRFSCNGCNAEFRVEDDLKRHFNAFPDACGKHRAEQLPESTYVPTRTVKKQTGHSYDCDICFQTFVKHNEWRTHKATAHLPDGGVLSFAQLVALPVDAALTIFPFLDDQALDEAKADLKEAEREFKEAEKESKKAEKESKKAEKMAKEAGNAELTGK